MSDCKDSDSEDAPPTTTVASFMKMLNQSKLERKHSSGDLQSRLKTRKILGVGETDNGDIHRSKISQVLGHNEHLYVKFPRCYWLWHLSMAIVFTSLGLMNLLLPDASHILSRLRLEEDSLETRFYGSVLLGFAVLLWSFWGTTDKSLARGLMSAIAVCQLAQLGALSSCMWQEGIWNRHFSILLIIRIILVAGNSYFYWAIGSSTAGLRKSNSYKDLREKQHSPEGQQSPTCCNTSGLLLSPPSSYPHVKKTE